MTWTPLVFVFVAALVAVGVVGYSATGRRSKTALIPAYFGAAVAVLWVVGWVTGLPGAAGWGALAIAALGGLATASAVPAAVRGQGGAAARYKALMCGCCALYVAAVWLLA